MTARRMPIAVCLLAVALTGCGTRAQHRRGGAEPAQSPIAAARPAGRSVSVGTHPEGIVVDPLTGLVAVATRDPAALVLLDVRGGRVMSRVPLPGVARHLALSDSTVLVPSEPLNRLLEVSLPRGRVSSIAVGKAPHDAAGSAGRIFVGDEFGKDVSVVEHGRVIHTVGGFLQPGGATVAGALVAVIDVGADTLSLIDPRTLRTLGTTAAGSGPTHGVGDPSGHVYVADTRGGAVLEFAIRPRLCRVARLALPGTPYGIAVDHARNRLWVTLTATNRLVEFGLRGGVPRRLRSYPTGRQPNTVAVDTRTVRVFVACAVDGTVEVINPR